MTTLEPISMLAAPTIIWAGSKKPKKLISRYCTHFLLLERESKSN
jgi:hypothetical protein